MKNPTFAPSPLTLAFAGLLGAALACGSGAAAQSPYRVPTLRERAPAAVQAMLPILKAARQHRLPRLAPSVTKTLSYPYGIAVGQGGVTYITNLYSGVNIYDSAHKLLGTITSGLSYPAAVATSFNGDIFVANNGGNNVTIYSPSWQPVGTITDSTLISPTSMYIDQDDTIWVLDAGGTVHPYLNNGSGSMAALPTTHSGGTAIGPWGPNVTVWGILNSSGAYDEDYENRAEADYAGVNLFESFTSPYAGGEAEDAAGQQYVSDLSHDQVQIWSSNGLDLVALINTPAPPYGVAVDSVNKRVYVVMTTLNEVYVYSTVAPYAKLAIIH